MLPFSIRNWIELSLVSAGINERQERQEEFSVLGFDNRPWENGRRQYRRRREIESVDLMIGHVSAVKGGFGVGKKRVAFWLAVLLGKRACPSDAMAMVKQVVALGNPRKQAHRLALWERYRKLPYHQIGAANGDNLANHDIERETWHGNRGNKDGAGLAIDCGAGEDLDDWLIETGRAAFRSLALRIDPTQTRPIRYTSHRAMTGDRMGDTGGNVHREIIRPSVDALDNVSIDYELRRGKKGRPIPDRWDDRALFDWKGRRIKP